MAVQLIAPGSSHQHAHANSLLHTQAAAVAELESVKRAAAAHEAAAKRLEQQLDKEKEALAATRGALTKAQAAARLGRGRKVGGGGGGGTAGEEAVMLPVPYSLPPVPYGAGDVPWSWNATKGVWGSARGEGCHRCWQQALWILTPACVFKRCATRVLLITILTHIVHNFTHRLLRRAARQLWAHP